MFHKIIVLLTVVLGLVIAEQVKYHGHKVFTITPKNEAEVTELRNLEKLGLMFWSGPNPPTRSSDVMVPPHMLHIMDSIREKGIEISELVADVQRLIDETSGNLSNRTAEEDFAFDEYHTFDEIITWVKEQAGAHPDIASAFSIGNSSEGRELLILKIATPSSEPKRAIWLDANIHAREWITSAVTVYIINKLLNGNNTVYTSWIHDYDWYILTVHNPDGFVYSHDVDRMWRKTRSIHPDYPNCLGADPNRNWDFHWMEGGSSPNPCDYSYAGQSAFSEPETYHTSQFINTIGADLDAFISIHSYGQFILIPYGVEIEFPPHDVHMEIGQRASDAIEAVHGMRFTPGNIVDIFYVASGGSMDWAVGTHSIPLTDGFELRGPFVLPPEEIIPSAEELLEGLNVMVNAVRDGIPESRRK